MRRALEAGSGVAALVALAFVLYNATAVDRRPPTIARISLSAPVAGGTERLGHTLTAIDVEFSEPVRTGTVEHRFRIEPFVAGTFVWEGTTTAIFTPSQRLPSDTVFVVSVEPGFEDLAGNAATSGLDGWQFRTVGPPEVIQSIPIDGMSGVPVDDPIRLTFDRLMDPGAVVSAVKLDPAVPYHASWSGPVLTLAFDRPLAFGQEYRLSVGTDASDTDGSHLVTPYSISFLTVAAGLGVQSIVPAPNVSGVSVRAQIALVFDAPIDPASIEGSLEITPSVPGDLRVENVADDRPTGGATAGSESPSASVATAQVLLFVPSSPLAAHTTYTVTVAPVIRRLGSVSEVAAGQSWSFTTGQPTASAQNQVAFVSARGGVRNVWLMNPDGSNPRQLTAELVPVTDFDVTPDGQTVAYAAGGAVKLMRTDGSGLQTLTSPGRLEYAPAFTPDGAALLLARRDAEGADRGYWLVPRPGTGDGQERSLLPAGAPPLGSVGVTGEGIVAGTGTSAWSRRVAFSADGRTVALVAATGDVYLHDTTEPDLVPIELPVMSDASPVWVPEEASFFLVARRAGETGSFLWEIHLDGSLVRFAAAEGAFAVAADGGIAVLQSAGSIAGEEPVRLAYGRTPQTELVALTNGRDLSDRSPAFSPNGRIILFSRVRVVSPTTSAGIWTVDPDGTELRQLSTDGAYPRWLP